MYANEVAQRLGISVQGVREAARTGRFGAAARRDARNRWVFDFPDAKRQWLANTDLSRVAGERVEERCRALEEEKRAPLERSSAAYLAWLLDAASAALEDVDRLSLAEIIEAYVASECPTALDDWRAGRIVAERDL